MEKLIETYIGRGLYASFDGWQFRLRAPRENGDHVVYLERSVLAGFVRFAAAQIEYRDLIRGIVKVGNDIPQD